MDVETERRILDNIKSAFRGATCIFISHRLSTIEAMELVYFLERPDKINIGTHNEFLKNNPAYRDFLA